MIDLWPHQAEAAEKIRSGEIKALWWEMRTGKTLAAIAGSDDGDRLIVCPNSVKPTWANDLQLWGQDSYIWGTKPRPSIRPQNVIINYESLWRSPLLDWNWDTVIFDESQRLQNPRTKLWDCIHAHIKDLCSARVVLLSGTPCPEGFHQLITQSIAATGQFCGHLDPWSALRAGWVYDDNSYKWIIQPGQREASQAQLHQLGRTMTQAQAGINTHKLYRRMPVQAGTHEQRIWKQVMKQDPRPEGAQLGLVAQSCASGRNPETGETVISTKLDAVADWIIDAARPAVCLCRFRTSLEYLVGKLQAKGLKVGAIHGQDEGSAARGQVIQTFNESRLDVIVANVATVKVGLNLSHADTLVFCENSFSGEARIQAEERCTVRGKGAVEVVDFITVDAGTGDLLGEIDDAVLACVREKKDFNSAVMRLKGCESPGTREYRVAPSFSS